MPMGGNRPGGNNLAEIVMFGKMTGQFIAKGIKTKKILPLNEKIIERKIKWLADLTIHSKGENPITEKQKLQHMMMKRAGVMKNEKGFKLSTRPLNHLPKTIRKYLKKNKVSKLLLG